MTRNRSMVALVFVVFFVMSLLTNILGPIVPDIISGFHVTLAAAALLPFSFFIAYGVMSIPAGFFVERFSEKPVMIAAFLAGAVGSLSFALFPRYSVAVWSLFIMGAGMATLQTAINPLLRVSGGEEHFAFNSAFAQLIFGSASFVSPRIYSYLVQNLNQSSSAGSVFLRILGRLTPQHLPWASMYWIFALLTVLMIGVLAKVKFPRVERTTDEAAGSWEMYGKLARKPLVWLFFVSVFAYVGSEQGTADWISKFLAQYHGFDPHTTGASAVSWFWGLLTAGCFIGMLLLKIFDSRKVLIGTCIGALLCVTAALFGPANIAVIAFPAIGLFASVMWPILVSLALNSVSEYHGSFAGILSTGIMGGAVVPLVIGRIGDHVGLRAGLAFLYLTFGCVLSVGFWARPIVQNATVPLKKNSSSSRRADDPRRKEQMPAHHRIHQPCLLEVGILLTITLAAVSSWGQTPAAPKDSGPIPYLKLSEPRHILPTAQAWERNEFPHTMSVLEYNHDGFRYWGWYGLNEGEGIGLARSKDLKDWVKYDQNPLWTNARWPSVLQKADSKHPEFLYFAITRDYDTPSSHIVLASSRDGIHLTEEKVLVQGVPNQRNQNPNLFQDPKSGRFYLTFYRGNDHDHFEIISKSAAAVTDLDKAPEKVLMTDTITIAAPTLLYVKNGKNAQGKKTGIYYLATEIYPHRYTTDPEGEWLVKVFAGDSPDGNFQPVQGNPIMSGQRACLFQHIFNGRFYGFDCHLESPKENHWILEETEAPLP